jgi:tetratricopeptide (TPR) repeat protein
VRATILESIGAFEEAAAAYGLALEWQPDLVELSAGMRRCLTAPDRTTTQRLDSVIPPSVDWLSLEIARQELELTVLQHDKKKCRRCHAEVTNFIGLLLATAALGWRTRPAWALQFLEFAERDYYSALENAPTWSRPHENLADTLEARAERLTEQDPGRAADARRCRVRAIEHYGVALSLLGSSDGDASHRRTILLSQAYTRLFIGTAEDRRRSIDHVFRAVQPPWSADDELEGRYLYNLGAWHAGAISVGMTEGSKRTGRRYLACAFARFGAAPRIMNFARSDPALGPLFGSSEAQATACDDIEAAISETNGETPVLARLRGDSFGSRVEAILQRVHWQ